MQRPDRRPPRVAFWRRVSMGALALLLLLDVARSVIARLGYRQPVERWQPAARDYADLAWPPGNDVPPGASLGARVYAQRCAVCHGPDGRGNGPAAFCGVTAVHFVSSRITPTFNRLSPRKHFVPQRPFSTPAPDDCAACTFSMWISRVQGWAR